MLKIVLDPYETYSPYDMTNWKPIRKTRWSGDDNYREGETFVQREINRQKKISSALVRVSNTVKLRTSADDKLRRKRRWGSQARTKLTMDDIEQFKARIDAINRISQKLLFPNATPDKGDPFLELEEPPPIYDKNGVRTNTIEIRYREKLEYDKNLLIYQLITLNPTYTPPSTYKPPNFEMILWFPVKKYPDANFVGAILGPRGNTQKRLEKETGCKIAVRGKGAEKNIVRQIKNPFTGEIDEMGHHVYICATSEDKLENGVEKIKPLLKPQTDIARMEQMKELALINGTYRFDLRCKECGEMGHKEFQCPQRQNTYFANIQCEKCKDISHATQDCPQKGIFESDQKEMELEYRQFMAEINGENPEEAKKRMELEERIRLERKKNEEKFVSKRHNTAVTLMKPNVLDETILNKAMNSSISEKRRIFTG